MTDWTPGESAPTSTWDDCGAGPASTWEPCVWESPVLTAISPATGQQDGTAPVTLTGENFSPDSAVLVSGIGITVTNMVVVDPFTITCDLVILAGATLGDRTVTVTAAGGISNDVTFTVTSSTLTLTSVSPATGNQMGVIAMTLVGTQFVAGATVQVSGTGVTVSNVVVVDTQHITATFTVAADAALTQRDVTVTTP